MKEADDCSVESYRVSVFACGLQNLNGLVPIWTVVPQKIILFVSCTIRYFVTRISYVAHNQAKC